MKHIYQNIVAWRKSLVNNNIDRSSRNIMQKYLAYAAEQWLVK